MLQKILLFLSLSMLTPAFTACVSTVGSGEFTTQIRSLEPFTKIIAIDQAVISLTNGTTDECSVTTDENIQDVYETTVTDGTLRISHARNEYIASSRDIEVECTITQKITDIYLMGESPIEWVGDTPLIADTINLWMTEYSKSYTSLDLTLEADTINTYQFGRGSVTLSGSATHHYVDIYNSSADLSAYDLITQDTYIYIRGVSIAQINVTDTLIAHLDGSGSVYYTGISAPTKTTILSDSGTVEPAP